MYAFPTVIVTYNGKPLSKKEYDEHPEIHHLYPSTDVFIKKIYLPLLQKTQETNTVQVLEISEHSIKINGESFLLL